MAKDNGSTPGSIAGSIGILLAISSGFYYMVASVERKNDSALSNIKVRVQDLREDLDKHVGQYDHPIAFKVKMDLIEKELKLLRENKNSAEETIARLDERITNIKERMDRGNEP